MSIKAAFTHIDWMLFGNMPVMSLDYHVKEKLTLGNGAHNVPRRFNADTKSVKCTVISPEAFSDQLQVAGKCQVLV